MYALQNGYFLIRCESGTLWTPNPKFLFFYPDDVTRSSPVPYREINSQDGCQGQYYFFTSWTYFKKYHVCAVKHSNEHCTLQLCQTAHALLPLFPSGVLSTIMNLDTLDIINRGTGYETLEPSKARTMLSQSMLN